MNSPTKPNLVHVIAWTTLASGVVNILFGITALGTFIGFICAPFSILPIIFGSFELVYAAKLFGTQPVKPSTNIAVIEIACVLFGNAFAMAVGILSLVFYNDSAVKEYFARLNNGTLTPAPASPSNVTPAPAVEALPPPVAESPAALVEESSTPTSKPKRAPRKAVKK